MAAYLDQRGEGIHDGTVVGLQALAGVQAQCVLVGRINVIHELGIVLPQVSKHD